MQERNSSFNFTLRLIYDFTEIVHSKTFPFIKYWWISVSSSFPNSLLKSIRYWNLVLLSRNHRLYSTLTLSQCKSVLWNFSLLYIPESLSIIGHYSLISDIIVEIVKMLKTYSCKWFICILLFKIQTFFSIWYLININEFDALILF